MIILQSTDQMRSQNPGNERKMLVLSAVQIILIGLWVFLLRETSSYYSIYVMCAAAGILCTIKNTRDPVRSDAKSSWMLLIFAVWFASTTVLANYKLFTVRPLLERLFCAAAAFLGGTISGYQTIRFVADRLPLSAQERTEKLSTGKYFLRSFLLMEGLFFIYLVWAAYPAYFTPDVFNSVRQIMTGVYINQNPYWYTISIKVIAAIGYAIFDSANAAMAFYVFWQGLCMSAIFSYVLVTLYQIGISKWVIAVCGAVYALLPYNIAYSATMLKDIPFSIASLLFVVSLYRIIRNVGKNQNLNYLFFFIGAFVFCLMRTNGLASFGVTMLAVIPLMSKSRKRQILVIMVVVIMVTAWFLTGPLLKKWDVGSMDFVEGLAIPFQQIARVIAMGYELEPEEYEFLNQIFDVDLIPEVFMHGCVDPIKGTAFRSGGKAFIQEHKMECVKFWLQWAKKYPGDYLKAWIEQTKGYWNGGYKYWVYYAGGENQAIGIVRPETLPLRGLFEKYFALVESLVLSRPFYSIGLHVWLMFGCLVLNIKQKKPELVMIIPGGIIILGLWLGTPVYSEFRYAYPMILSMPLVICTTLYRREEK